MTSKFKPSTVHTSRTMMFAELSKVMDYAIDSDNYIDSLWLNVTGKKSNSGIKKTLDYLKKLYGFNNNYNAFKAFKYFWQNSDTHERPFIAFLYAINHDYLLVESIDVLQSVRLGQKAAIETFEENLETYHPNWYSDITRKSIAKNLASSWKQAGFIQGKVKNIRVQPVISPAVLCFAFLLAYLKGDRGDFILKNTGVRALCLNETQVRDLAIECAKKDLMKYHYSGGVTSISFDSLFTKIGFDAV